MNPGDSKPERPVDDPVSQPPSTMTALRIAEQETRATDRVGCRTKVSCRRAGADPVNGQLMNLSAGGAQLIIRGSFEIGERLGLVLFSPRLELVSETDAEIRWKRPEGPGAVRLGVQFSSPLAPEQLRIATGRGTG
jgi:c-di-GMP-binding flagellar brake protein YcgR